MKRVYSLDLPSAQDAPCGCVTCGGWPADLQGSSRHSQPSEAGGHSVASLKWGKYCWIQETVDCVSISPAGPYLGWIMSVLSMSGVSLWSPHLTMSRVRQHSSVSSIVWLCIVWYLKLIKQCHKGVREREGHFIITWSEQEDGDKVNKGFPSQSQYSGSVSGPLRIW